MLTYLKLMDLTTGNLLNAGGELLKSKITRIIDGWL